MSFRYGTFSHIISLIISSCYVFCSLFLELLLVTRWISWTSFLSCFSSLCFIFCGSLYCLLYRVINNYFFYCHQKAVVVQWMEIEPGRVGRLFGPGTLSGGEARWIFPSLSHHPRGSSLTCDLTQLKFIGSLDFWMEMEAFFATSVLPAFCVSLA